MLLSNERFYKFSWILTLREVISIRILRMRLISTIMNFQKLSNERSYKFSWILTLREVISIRILRMCLMSAIMNFYWSHTIPASKIVQWTFLWVQLNFNSNRSYKH